MVTNTHTGGTISILKISKHRTLFTVWTLYAQCSMLKGVRQSQIKRALHHFVVAAFHKDFAVAGWSERCIWCNLLLSIPAMNSMYDQQSSFYMSRWGMYHLGLHKYKRDSCHQAHSAQLIKSKGDFSLSHRATGEVYKQRRGSPGFLCLRIAYGGKIPLNFMSY